MKKLIALLVLVSLLLGSVSALAETTKVAVIYSATVDDKGWCQAMDSGIKNAIAQGYDIDYTPIESVAIPDAPDTIERLVGDYDLIIVHGAQFANALTAVAEENPDQVFVVGTSDKILGDNIFTYMPQSEEPGYLNGIAAGMLSKNGKVGVVGSSDSGDAYRYVRGFVLGFRSVCPDAADPMVTWTNSFDDSVGAGNSAELMINAELDVLTGSSQQAVGALRKVAAASGVLWTAQTLAQMVDFPEVTVCAADYEYSAVLIEVLKAVEKGTKGGVCIPLNYSNNGFVFEFSANADLMPDDVKAAVETALEALRAEPNTIDYDSVKFE